MGALTRLFLSTLRLEADRFEGASQDESERQQSSSQSNRIEPNLIAVKARPLVARLER